MHAINSAPNIFSIESSHVLSCQRAAPGISRYIFLNVIIRIWVELNIHRRYRMWIKSDGITLYEVWHLSVSISPFPLHKVAELISMRYRALQSWIRNSNSKRCQFHSVENTARSSKHISAKTCATHWTEYTLHHLFRGWLVGRSVVRPFVYGLTSSRKHTLA